MKFIHTKMVSTLTQVFSLFDNQEPLRYPGEFSQKHTPKPSTRKFKHQMKRQIQKCDNDEKKDLFIFGNINAEKNPLFQFGAQESLPSSAQGWIDLWDKNALKKKQNALHSLLAFYKGTKTRKAVKTFHQKEGLKDKLLSECNNRVLARKAKTLKLEEENANLKKQLAALSRCVIKGDNDKLRKLEEENTQLKEQVASLTWLSTSTQIENTLHQRQVHFLRKQLQ